jgi:hypothetical protein
MECSRIIERMEASLDERHAHYQESVEAISLALLALRSQRGAGLERLLHRLLVLQNSDGSWPAFAEDEREGCWATALAVLAMMVTAAHSERVASGIRWLVNAKGREAGWFWRWKLRVVDNQVLIDPSKYGWSWVPGTASWVIPTALSILALLHARQRGIGSTGELNGRVENGVGMLFDRICPSGGWNAGNGMAFGVPYAPYVDTTAIALLALSGRQQSIEVRRSLAWLASRLPACPSPYSLAWGVLALTAYRGIDTGIDESARAAAGHLVQLVEDGAGLEDACTLPVCALALDAVDGENVFRVRG